MLERVAAIKAALGLPTEVVGALPIVAAANIAMGIQPDECMYRERVILISLSQSPLALYSLSLQEG